jgi:hypothetical protein
MTLSAATNKVAYAGNGATTAFAFTFKCWSSADLKVYKRNNTTLVDTLQTITTHYTVSGTLPGTGDVVFGTAPSASETVIIVRENSMAQDLDLIANGAFEAEEVEKASDKIVGMIQNIDAKNGLAGTATIDFASVANGAVSAASNVTVTGARVGDWVIVNAAGDIETTDGVFLFGKVTANDTVEVTLLNMSGGAFNAASQAVFALVIPRVNFGL